MLLADSRWWLFTTKFTQHLCLFEKFHKESAGEKSNKTEQNNQTHLHRAIQNFHDK